MGWPQDVQPINMFTSSKGLSLIDYGTHKKCCNGPQKCAVDSGFEDVKVEQCDSHFSSRWNFEAGSQIIELMLDLALAFTPPSRFSTSMSSDWFKRLHNSSLESLVTELRSSSGPSREMFQNQWGPENAKVMLAMASTKNDKDVQWPPPFMEQVKIALESVPPVDMEL